MPYRVVCIVYIVYNNCDFIIDAVFQANLQAVLVVEWGRVFAN